jgi:hypothetical protein
MCTRVMLCEAGSAYRHITCGEVYFCIMVRRFYHIDRARFMVIIFTGFLYWSQLSHEPGYTTPNIREALLPLRAMLTITQSLPLNTHNIFLFSLFQLPYYYLRK